MLSTSLPATDMPTPHDPKAEVLNTIHALLHLWGQRDAEAFGGFLSYVAEDFRGFGTGPGEYVTGRAALRELMHREHEEMDYPITVTVPWMEVHLLRPDLALAEGEIRLEIHLEQGPHVMKPRCSFVLERREGRWLVIHFHFSVPDAMLTEGGTLMEGLEARNRELEREVARRTAELNQSLAELRATQARLVQQEKMASLGALTAGIAHEIKNPLNFVNNFAALSRELVDELQEETDPDEARALLADLKTNAEKIELHGQRADGIIRAMLEHARGGSGARCVVDLNALVAEFAELAWHGKRAQTTGFTAEFTEELDAGVGEVTVVPRDIGRVVLNLIGNAFDAVHERAARAEEPYSPRVAVTTRCVGECVEIRVTDNGGGVPEDVREKIFEPFFTTKPTGSGTGLGLSLSYDIVTQGHGGTLAVESEPGEGATFVVSLPAGEGEGVPGASH